MGLKAKQQRAVSWPRVALMWTLSQVALISLLYSTQALHAGCIFTAFYSITILTTMFACHGCQDLFSLVLAYLGAISVATAWLDVSLLPFVAVADVTAAIPLLGSVLIAPVSEVDAGGRRVSALAAATTASATKLAEAKARAIAGACFYSPAKAGALLLCLAFATALELSSPDVRLLQPLWAPIVARGEPYVRNYLLPVTVATATYVVVCAYFSYLDLTRSVDTKVQRDWWPSARDMWKAAVPQLAVYCLGQVQVWGMWYLWPEENSYETLPEQAPTCLGLLTSLAFCLVVGDFLIYWEHRLMHAVPFLRTKVHSVHHEYSAVFSWAGGWVHPAEDIVVVVCQAAPVLLIRPHPLTQWLFAAIWVTCLVDEHSGHDVWWSPYQLLPCTGCPQGGGAAPHDIHHYKPTKNYGFIFVTWDRLFGTFEAVTESHPSNPFVPPLSRERKQKGD